MFICAKATLSRLRSLIAMREPRNEMDLIRVLHLKNRVHNSDDFTESVNILARYFKTAGFRGDTRIHEYPSGVEYNFWKVPEKWVPVKCELRTTKGECIISSQQHPLVLVPFSCAFSGRVSRDELLQHLFFREDMPEAIPYVFRWQYRHWEKKWGIAMPYQMVKKLSENEYVVHIEAEFVPGTMKVLEYTLPGAKDQIIFMCAHMDHPGQCNDGLSGTVHIMETMKRLEGQFAKTTYTYKLILCPEIIGSAIYLDQNAEVVKKAIACLCTNMVGHDALFTLCQSRMGNSRLDMALHHVLKRRGVPFKFGIYRKYPNCGDEVSFDAPGIEIPTTTFSRLGGEAYPFYHTSFDTPDQIDEAKLREAIAIAAEALAILEEDYTPTRNFSGYPCLANPKFDLYLEPRNVSNLYNKAAEISSFVHIQDKKKPIDPRLFMDFVLSNLEGNASLLEIAEGFSVPFEFVKNYVNQFVERGLALRGPVIHPRMFPGYQNAVSRLVQVSDTAYG